MLAQKAKMIVAAEVFMLILSFGERVKRSAEKEMEWCVRACLD